MALKIYFVYTVKWDIKGYYETEYIQFSENEKKPV